MNDKDFRKFGKAMIDYVADYTENLRDRDVLPNVEPGYLAERIPKEAPEKAETWQQVLDDVEKHIMPGITHWNSPNFHAYFATGNSYPAIVGEILSAGIGCIGFSWIASPACTELEMITMDWLGKMLGLPEYFLNSHEGHGGGVLQGSASESTLVGLLTAREITVNRIKREHPDYDEGMIRSKLVAYTSDQANSSVEKAGRHGSMIMRLLPSDDKCRMRGCTVLDYIKKDLEAGLIPCYLVATLGTTPTCAFDALDEIGPICNEYKVWLHVDAAYAGAALICPEYRHLLNGIELVDSFNFNPHKWLLVNFDCSALWVKDSRHLVESFSVERIYLANNKLGSAPDYRHWQIPLGRRFRSLKLWFVLRLYGIEGLQKHIRRSIELAELFEKFVNTDERFEIVVDTSMGLVCFRLKGDDNLTKRLIDKLMARRKIYVIPGAYKGKMLVRFAICSRMTMQDDIEFAWNEISGCTDEILQSMLKEEQKIFTFNEDFDVLKKKSGDIMSIIMEIETKIETQNSKSS